jgi:hypothetical protein
MINIADLTDPNDPNERSYREINNAKKHKFRVGQLVEIEHGVRLFVARQTRDCDGTPLYSLTPKKDDHIQTREGFGNSNWVNNWPENSMKAL